MGGPSVYEAERPKLGDVESIDVPERRVTVPAAPGGSGADVAALLEAVRAEGGDARLWEGVSDVTPQADGATVAFHDGHDPQLRRQGGVEVACHLYDERFAAQAQPASD